MSMRRFSLAGSRKKFAATSPVDADTKTAVARLHQDTTWINSFMCIKSDQTPARVCLQTNRSGRYSCSSARRVVMQAAWQMRQSSCMSDLVGAGGESNKALGLSKSTVYYCVLTVHSDSE